MSTAFLKFFVFIFVGKLIPVNLFSLILAGYVTHQILGILNGTWKSFLSILLVFFLLFRSVLSDDIHTSSTNDDVDEKPASTPNSMGGPIILDSVCTFSLLTAYEILKLLHGLGLLVGWLVEIVTVYVVGRTLRKGGSLINQAVVFLLGLWLFCRLNFTFAIILKKSTPTLPIPPNITWDVSKPWTRDTVSLFMGSVLCFRIICISLITLCLGGILFIFYKNVIKRSGTITPSQVVLNFFWMLFAINCVLCYIGYLNEKQINIFGRMMEASSEGTPMTEPKSCDAFWQVCPLRAIEEAGEITINCTIKEPFQNIGTTLMVIVDKLEEMFYS